MQHLAAVFGSREPLKGSGEIKVNIQTELDDLQTEIEAVAPLLDKVRLVEPDAIEIRAIATTLHAFYNGIERVFLIIAKELDGKVPQSVHWHRELLDQMSQPARRRVKEITSLPEG